MGEKEQYNALKKKLLLEETICESNRELFKKFFKWQERKLQSINGLRQLDNACYKTLRGYTTKLKNVNAWFNNKPLKDITKKDIEKVFNDLEDGKIKNKQGKPMKDTKSYYNKIFKSKLFQMVGKADIAKEVMEFYKPPEDEDVRFITEEQFKKLVEVTIQPKQKCLLWLAWDIGENIFSLLTLTKKDCIRQINDNGDPEYNIVLSKEILKRKRTHRTEPTNYPETVQFLDILLHDKKEKDLLFDFKYRMAAKFLARAVKKTGVRCKPKGQEVTLKDMRSSMACHLLAVVRWHEDEIKARLGHKSSSRVIDKYVNYFALNKHVAKEKVHNHSITKVNEELKEAKQREKLNTQRIERMQKQLNALIDGVVLERKVYNRMTPNFKSEISHLTHEVMEQEEILEDERKVVIDLMEENE